LKVHERPLRQTRRQCGKAEEHDQLEKSI
jgi:hypothetical protein